MRTMDLSPFRRSSVGFDRMLNQLNHEFAYDQTDHPPYDIQRTGENTFRISVALPGYKADQVEIVAQENVLTVSSKKEERGEADYLHRGIKSGPFERRFSLADYVEVRNASMVDGLLQIDLEHVVPEALRPRRININAAGGENITTIDQKKAS